MAKRKKYPEPKRPAVESSEPEKWLDRIRRAQKIREAWRNDFRVSLAYEYFEGRQRPSWASEREWITINMIYSTLLAMLPSLYNQDPYFYIRLRRSYSPQPMDIALFEVRAKVRQAMLNYLAGELELKSHARLCVQDAFFQFGIIKICHYSDLAENPDAGKPMKDGEMALLDEDGDPLLEPELLPSNEAYQLLRIHPDDFLVDEDAGPLWTDIAWKAQQIRMPLEDAKANKKYKKSARSKLEATATREGPDTEREKKKKGALQSMNSETEEPDIAVLWEVYDLRNKQMLVVSEGCKEEFLIPPTDLPEGIERDPFVDLRFTLRDDSFYPIPPASQWLDPQREYCESRSKLLSHLKRFNRKYTAWRGAFDDPEAAMAKLETGDDGTVIAQEQPGQAVWPIQDAPLDQQMHMQLAYLRKDFDDLAIGANQRGSTAGVDSATEAGILEVRAKLREGDWGGLVVDFVTKIGRKIDQQVQANITRDEAIKVSGPQGEYWEQIRVQDYEKIAGEYEYSVNVGSMTPQLPEIERAQWTAFLTLIGTVPWLALSDQLLKEMARIHHIENEVLVQQLKELAEKVVTGQFAPQPSQGSQPNVSTQNPQAAMGGAAAGIANMRGGR